MKFLQIETQRRMLMGPTSTAAVNDFFRVQ